jgi:hypothetical protein
MLLKKSRKRSFELASSIPVNDPNRALIVQQRFVEEALGFRERFVHTASNHVQIDRRCLARLKIYANADLRRRGGWTDDAQIAQARPHSLAADIEIGRMLVNRCHHRLEAQRAEDDAVADRRALTA